MTQDSLGMFPRTLTTQQLLTRIYRQQGSGDQLLPSWEPETWSWWLVTSMHWKILRSHYFFWTKNENRNQNSWMVVVQAPLLSQRRQVVPSMQGVVAKAIFLYRFLIS